MSFWYWSNFMERYRFWCDIFEREELEKHTIAVSATSMLDAPLRAIFMGEPRGVYGSTGY